MKARTFGFVAGPSSASRERREPDLGTSQGLIEHSMRHGEDATLVAVAERGVRPGALKQTVAVIEARNGQRVVARAEDVERERNRPLTRKELKAQDANEQFLRDTNPRHEAPRHGAVKVVDVGKRPLTRSKP